MTTKPPDFPELNNLAIEACDIWQEHLATLASDPAARADLTRLLEPQRRLFADWAALMQKGGKPESPSAPPDAAPKPAATEPVPPSSSTTGGAARGDDPLRVAQLALRVAELEKRIAQLESRAASGGGKSGASRRTERAAS